MANLQIKGMDDHLYAQIKALAESENRSVSQEVLFMMKSYLANKRKLQKTRTPAQVLLDLSGSWEGPDDADEMISRIRNARRNSVKLKNGF